MWALHATLHAAAGVTVPGKLMKTARHSKVFGGPASLSLRSTHCVGTADGGRAVQGMGMGAAEIQSQWEVQSEQPAAAVSQQAQATFANHGNFFKPVFPPPPLHNPNGRPAPSNLSAPQQAQQASWVRLLAPRLPSPGPSFRHRSTLCARMARAPLGLGPRDHQLGDAVSDACDRGSGGDFAGRATQQAAE